MSEVIEAGEPLASPTFESIEVGEPVGRHTEAVPPKPPITPERNREGNYAAAVRAISRPVFGLGELGSRMLGGAGDMLSYLPGSPDRENPLQMGAKAWSAKNERGRKGMEARTKRMGADEDHTGAAILGTLASPVNLLGGEIATAALPAKTAAARYGQAAIAGGFSGLADTVDDVKNYWNHKLSDLVGGAGGALAFQGAAHGAGNVIMPKVQEAVNLLKNHGVDITKLTPGQLIGGSMRTFEDWLKDYMPGGGMIAARQGEGAKAYATGPVKKAMEIVGHNVDESRPMDEIFQGAQNAATKMRDDAVAGMPLIEMKARLNKAGTDYVGNYGSRAFFNKLMQEAETWRHTKSVSGVKQANTQGDAAANAVSHAIQEYALKPFEQLGNKSTIYAEPIKVKNSIEQLNKRIDDLYGRIKNKDATDFDRGHLNALENVRDHLRGLMKETAPGQYVKLRAGDAAYSDLQTPQSASAKAAGARKGVYGPQDLIDAIREDVNGNDKILAAGAGRYQPFATEGFDVVGDPMKHRDHSLTGLLEHAFGISMAPVGAPAVGAFYNSPARTAAAKWYTGQGPVHRAARTFAEGVRNAPARMGGLSAYAMDPIANSLFTGTPDNGDR